MQGRCGQDFACSWKEAVEQRNSYETRTPLADQQSYGHKPARIQPNSTIARFVATIESQQSLPTPLFCTPQPRFHGSNLFSPLPTALDTTLAP